MRAQPDDRGREALLDRDRATASHQRCLDLRKELGLPSLELEPDPDDELEDDEPEE